MVGQVSDLVARIRPERTVLLFGSGSSIPSNVPSVADLQAIFEDKFNVSASDYSLAEQTGIIEAKTGDRRGLIVSLRAAFKGATPTGGLLNLPLFTWKSIFTTNYDELIEASYKRRSRPYASYSSNFDFGQARPADAVQLFKLHGTIGKDVADGDRSRIILTAADYDLTEEFREQLFDRFKADIGGDHLVIIGHSLADPDIKAVVDRALTIKAKSGGGGEISILSYSRDDGRASLLRSRGMSVYFGGLDDFFAALSARAAGLQVTASAAEDPLDIQSSLRPATVDVAHALHAATLTCLSALRTYSRLTKSMT